MCFIISIPTSTTNISIINSSRACSPDSKHPFACFVCMHVHARCIAYACVRLWLASVWALHPSYPVWPRGFYWLRGVSTLSFFGRNDHLLDCLPSPRDQIFVWNGLRNACSSFLGVIVLLKRLCLFFLVFFSRIWEVSDPLFFLFPFERCFNSWVENRFYSIVILSASRNNDEMLGLSIARFHRYLEWPLNSRFCSLLLMQNRCMGWISMDRGKTLRFLQSFENTS